MGWVVLAFLGILYSVIYISKALLFIYYIETFTEKIFLWGVFFTWCPFSLLIGASFLFSFGIVNVLFVFFA